MLAELGVTLEISRSVWCGVLNTAIYVRVDSLATAVAGGRLFSQYILSKQGRAAFHLVVVTASPRPTREFGAVTYGLLSYRRRGARSKA